METKFNISDIIRYMLIGLFFTFSSILIYCVYSDISFIGYLKKILSSSSDASGLSMMVLLLLMFYFFGVVIQGVSKLFISFYFWSKRKMKGINSKTNYQKKLIRPLYHILYGLFYRITPEARCFSLKRQNRLDVPEWIKISKNPPKLMEHIKLSMEIRGIALNINEYFHFSVLFQGIYMSSIILFIPSIALFIWGFAGALQLIIIFAITGCISYLLSSVYATRAIMTLDIKKEALEIDVSKNMRKIGIQQVHVLIRTCRPKPREAKTDRDIIEYQLKYLEEAIVSVGNQDYYSINILLLGERYCVDIDKKVKEILEREQYKDKLSIHYCFERKRGIAHSSRSIRNHILDIVDDNDIIMFLNDDDFFYRNNAISEIVYRMNSLNANLCLSAFNINSKKDDNIVIKNGRLHNALVKKISRYNKAVTKDDQSLWHFASTISWTKIYRANLLRQLNNITKEIKDSELKELVAFEDFMDYLVFLLKDIKVTAVSEPVYSYRKHDKGNTHKRDINAFKKLRIGYLHIVNEVAKLVHTCNDQGQCDSLFKDGINSSKRIKSVMCDNINVENYLGLKIYEITGIVEQFVASNMLDLSKEINPGKDKQTPREWFMDVCKEKIKGDKDIYWDKARFDERVAELENFEFR